MAETDMSEVRPEPPTPDTESKHGSWNWRRTGVYALVAVVIAVAVLFAVPAIMGANPVDVLSGKATAQQLGTAEARIAQGGTEGVVAAAKQILPSVVTIEVRLSTGGALGSGFVYRSDGYIVTNNHVVQGALSIGVDESPSSGTLPAHLVGTDVAHDLAVIKVDGQTMQAATLGTSSDLVQGELAVAAGSPEGFQRSVTAGVISATGRTIDEGNGTTLKDAIQTDAPINPGNSGGPLVNALGDVVGINTAIISQSGGNEGIGFAIPIDDAKPIIDKLIGG